MKMLTLSILSVLSLRCLKTRHLLSSLHHTADRHIEVVAEFEFLVPGVSLKPSGNLNNWGRSFTLLSCALERLEETQDDKMQVTELPWVEFLMAFLQLEILLVDLSHRVAKIFTVFFRKVLYVFQFFQK